MKAPEPEHTSHRPDRQSDRRRVDLQGYIVRAGGISHLVDLVDLNYGGCGVSISTELQPGEMVTLNVRGRGSIPAQVRWFSDGRAGLDFTAAVTPSRKQLPRRAERIPVDAEVGVRVPGRNSYRVSVSDLSTDGCNVELVERPSVGDIMLVKIEGLEVLEAEVCWVEGNRAGLLFKNRLHPAVLDLVVKRLSRS